MKVSQSMFYFMVFAFISMLSCQRTTPTSSKEKILTDQKSAPSSDVLTSQVPNLKTTIDKKVYSQPQQQRENPYLSRKKSEENFIKNHRIDDVTVPIHLTGAFAWSSEKVQFESFRPPLYIKEFYPGVISYTKWVKQNPESENFSTENDQLEFYDEGGKLLKTFHVDESNPFLKLYPGIVNNFYNAEGKLIDKNEEPSRKEVHFRNSTNSVYIDEQTGFSQIIYTLYNSNKNGNVIDFRTTLILLDTLGNEVNRLSDKELFINDTYITPDGKFLAICTGGMVDINNFGNAMNGHREYGIQIFNLKNMSLIYQNSGQYSDGVSHWKGSANWIYFRLKNGEDDEIYDGHWYIIDPVKEEEYYRLFTDEELQDILLKHRNKVWKHKDYGQNILNAFDFKISTF
ncbi:MAG: hypothetical protein AAFZ15_30710 [Bacteroidota bacterium]